ncbi:hypothetical protein DBR32_13700 [Taibaiella sp. KBW10]|uniref:hypothetical protein n=1 Tax=Taibaiella sp. KBW10 TaxID=2153357 RepID=UPI000F5A0ADF|nr:hypothetical protein [Taibaiella sp. KBW10]RQO29964.1 hypothetical protein DBR32_13700 [Taibaiella sp. KBW10]
MIVYLNILFELICFLLALITLTKAGKKWLMFIPYLFIVLGIELWGMYAYAQKINSNVVYNFYVLLNFVFIQFVLHKICTITTNRDRTNVLFLFIFTLFFVSEVYYFGYKNFAVKSIIFSYFLISVQCLYYFYTLLKQDSFVNLPQHAPFWLAAGILFHAIGSTVSYLFYDYLVTIYLELGIPVRQIIFVFLNFILYGSWSYAFICKYRQRISS